MRLGRRLGDYLLSRRNLLGCSLALVALALVLLDPVGPAGVLLIIGFYLTGVAAVRRNAVVDRFGFDPKKLERRLQQQIADVSGRVPPHVTGRLQRIESIMRTQILPRLDCLPPGSRELYLLERTATDDIPTALANYLRLPGQGASGNSVRLMLLDDELALLEGQMRRIAAQVQREDMDRLLAHRRFLEDRFGRLDLSG